MSGGFKIHLQYIFLPYNSICKDFFPGGSPSNFFSCREGPPNFFLNFLCPHSQIINGCPLIHFRSQGGIMETKNKNGMVQGVLGKCCRGSPVPKNVAKGGALRKKLKVYPQRWTFDIVKINYIEIIEQY